MTTVAARRFGEQLLELRQCRKCNMRIACDPHWQTPGPIKHPRRQFQPALPRSSLQRAAQNRAVYFLNRFMDTDDASGPGMPGIKNLALVPNLGTVGVTAPSCTMPADLIPASGAWPQTSLQPGPNRTTIAVDSGYE